MCGVAYHMRCKQQRESRAAARVPLLLEQMRLLYVYAQTQGLTKVLFEFQLVSEDMETHTRRSTTFPPSPPQLTLRTDGPFTLCPFFFFQELLGVSIRWIGVGQDRLAVIDRFTDGTASK